MLHLFILLYLLSCVNTLKSESIGYFWHVSDFHLDIRYASNVTVGHANPNGVTGDKRDIFLGEYDKVNPTPDSHHLKLLK